MRYLTLGEVVELHRLVLGVTGGAPGIRNLALLTLSLKRLPDLLHLINQGIRHHLAL